MAATHGLAGRRRPADGSVGQNGDRGLESPDGLRDVGLVELVVGTTLARGGFHATGTSRMPQRRPIDLLPSDEARWADLVGGHLVR